MRVGFVYEEGKNAMVFKAAAAKAVELSVGVEIVDSPAPDLLKVPLVANRLLTDQSCEAVVALVHASEESHDAIALLHEKIIDVELSERKFVFLEALFDDEWKTDEELFALARSKTIDALRKIIRAPPQQTTPQSPDWMPGMPSAPSLAEPSESEALDFMGDNAGKLF